MKNTPRRIAFLIAAACFLLLAAAYFCGCQNGRYIGPSLGVSGGYEGVTVGLTLYGENPVTSGRTGLTNSPVQVTAAKPAADALPENSSPSTQP